MAFGLDQLKVPYAYISTQDVAKDANLKAKYDVIILAPVGRGTAAIISGMPMWGNPIPWKTTSLTPNLGKTDETDDMRPGLGLSGLMNLQKFVQSGGVFITVDDTTDLAVSNGFTPGVSVARAQRLKAVGDILRIKTVDAKSPIAYGYGDSLAMYCSNGPIFNVSNVAGGRGGRQRQGPRATGRGTPDDPDTVQGRTARRSSRNAQGRSLAGAAFDRRAAPQQRRHHSARPAAARRAALCRQARAVCLWLCWTAATRSRNTRP